MWKSIAFEKCLINIKAPHKVPKKNYLEHGEFPVVSQEATLISGYHNEVKHIVKLSKPVVVFGDHTQILKYIDFNFVVGADGVKILQPIDELDTKFFFYILKLLMPKGTGYARHYRLLKELKIPVPPLSEQQRIVSKLDAAFAEIDNAIESALRKEQAISELLSKVIKSKFEHECNTTPKKFSEVCTLQRGYDLPTKARRKGEYPLFSANGITDYIDEYKVTAPAVITGRSGTIGEVHYTESHNWALNTALYVKDFKGNCPKYIYYFLKSFNLKRFASGAGVPTLNRNVLSEEKVYINDSIDVQTEQCNQLDNLTELSSKFSEVQHDLISEYNLLKTAILTQELQPSEAA